MPRANRYFVPGHVYHLTHHCHNRQFLLKFARDNNDYRQRLRHALKQFDVSLLGDVAEWSLIPGSAPGAVITN